MAGLRPIDIARMRLVAQGVHRPESRRPLDTVRHLGAMQGQDLPGVLWSIGLRGSGVTEADVRSAFDRGEIVRSWPMRGTLHVTTPDDLRLILPLSRDRLMTTFATRRAELGISDADVDAATAAATVALAGRPMVRKELFDVFATAGQPTSGQRGAHLIGALAHAGLICLGPFVGREQALVLFDEWTPPTRTTPPRDEAIAQLALRYFLSHGPATEADFAWWANLTLRDVRAAIAAVDDRLGRVHVGTTTYFGDPAVLDGLGIPPGSRAVHLMPGFDEQLLGYADRSAALAPAHAQAIVPGNNGMFKSTIVVGGRVAGTWTRRATTAAIRVSVRPFAPLGTAARASLARSIDRFREFKATAVALEVEDPPGASGTL